MKLEQPPPTGNSDLDIWLQKLVKHLTLVSADWTITNKTEDKTLDCDCGDVNIVADVLGTLVDELKDLNVLQG